MVRVERIDCTVAFATGDDVRARFDNVVPAVGDHVSVVDGRLVAIAERRSALERQDPRLDGAVQVLAANVDVVVLIHGLDRPINANRIERELVIVKSSGAEPLVLLTKSDMFVPGSHAAMATTTADARRGTDAAVSSPADVADVVAQLSRRLRGARVEVLSVSASSGVGLGELTARLAGLTSVLLGPSGAGKSTLTNVLVGRDVQAIGDVRSGDKRGRHTTSVRQLVELPGGGALIDTPGLRNVAMMSDSALAEAFPDIAALVGQCRFHDCRHNGEPGCAIARAIGAGRLDPDRWANHGKLSAEISAESQAVAGRARRRRR